MTFGESVDAKVAYSAERIRAGHQENGWALPPAEICGQAQDECLDIPGWLRGLDQLTWRQRLLRRFAGMLACVTWHVIRRLKASYG